MRSFWFALKIAGLFAVVMAVVLAGTLMLFGKVVGHGVLREIGLLRAHEGLVLAEQIEKMLDDHRLDDPAVLSFISMSSHPLGAEFRIERGDRWSGAKTTKTTRRHHRPEHVVTVRDRQCKIVGPPNFETWVPLITDDEIQGFLVLGGPLHPPEERHSFFVGLLEIGGFALLGVVALALYLSAPLRRMGRSMNRIAAGDLDHRVPVRGKDEVAKVGDSFNEMADRISDMISGQKEFLAAVSHELRSPLTRMKMTLELLRIDGERSERINDIEYEIDALDGMVDELLVASRLDMQTSELNLAPEDIESAAFEAWTRVAAEADEHGMQLLLDLTDDARLVHADRSLLVRTLGNLFENAVHYAGCGVVRLTSRSAGPRVVLEISDEGPGVDDEALERLFEPFFRADPSRSRRTGATGLGLMIVRRTIEAHSGAVHASRNPNGGLTVLFDLEATSPPRESG